MTKTRNYTEDAQRDATNTAENFIDEILAQVMDEDKDKEISKDLFNDYDGGDAYHHESHVDKAYSLLESATLLDQLENHVETDYGLWSGLEPRQAISAQAAYTYGNAVMYYWSELIEKINEERQEGILSDALQDEQPEEVIKQIVLDIIRSY